MLRRPCCTAPLKVSATEAPTGASFRVKRGIYSPSTIKDYSINVEIDVMPKSLSRYVISMEPSDSGIGRLFVLSPYYVEHS